MWLDKNSSNKKIKKYLVGGSVELYFIVVIKRINLAFDVFSDKKFYLQLKRWVWSQSQRRSCPMAGPSTPNNPITTSVKFNILTGPKDGLREISTPTYCATLISTVISSVLRNLRPNLILNVFTRIQSVIFSFIKMAIYISSRAKA